MRTHGKGQAVSPEMMDSKESFSPSAERMSIEGQASGDLGRWAGTSMYRGTYCARTGPLPLLPSGPGGVGGIAPRRTRHIGNDTTAAQGWCGSRFGTATYPSPSPDFPTSLISLG